MNKDSTVLQGAFLLADKLCSPSCLSTIQKADWSRVGHVILEALKEICRQDEVSDCPNRAAESWKKRMVCVVWLKLLCREAEENVELAWRENPFFSLQNSLPKVSRVVLLELVKSAAAAGVFASFLLRLPHAQICAELERLVEHVRSDPVGEDDIRLLLEVWWELWKGRAEEKVGEEESIEKMFASQLAHLSSESSSLSPQAAKRLKLDTPDSADILHILLHALKGMKCHISSADLCFQSLSISLDALYTTFLIDQNVVLPAKEKLDCLCKILQAREENMEKLSPEMIQEALKDLRASHTPSQFQLCQMKLSEALKIITELAQFWQSSVLNQCDHSSPSYSAFLLEQSIQRVLASLEEAPGAGTDDFEGENDTLRGVLKSLSLPVAESSPEVSAEVAAVIITHHLEDSEDFAVLFASEPSWAERADRWLDCLEKNQGAFRQHGTLMSLASTLMSRLHSKSANVKQCHKLLKIASGIFSTLTLEDQNKALAAMLRLSSRGFFECSVPAALADGFEQELNMAFNCIIQGAGGASAGASQGNLTTAASLVARVAFQNPEATLRSCCHSAVFNKGAFSLMAKILEQLPGLRDQRGRRNGGRKKVVCNLLGKCLQDVIQTKSLSATEKEQFLKFLSLLMEPVTSAEGEGKRESILSPQEVVNTFVLPNLSATAHCSVDAELSMQLLQTALSVDMQEAATTPHWVLDCSPFPLLYMLAQLHNQTLRCWEQPPDHHIWSMDKKELLLSVLTTLGQVVGAEVAAAPSSWSRALFWLHNKMEELDWTVQFLLKPVWGEHFKNEVPSSLLAVCDLTEQEWLGVDLPSYGLGTGLLAWMECCSISDSLQSTMLSCLTLDQHKPDHVSMFSKGLLVALTQMLPWCSVSQWSRLLRALRELITSSRLHVPFSLEYVDFLPLLDLRKFSCELRLSVLLLRVLQLLCGSSCSDWLLADGWAHVGRLYAHAVRDMMNSLRAKLPLPSSGAFTASASTPPKTPATTDSNPTLICLKSREARDTSLISKDSQKETAPSQEVLFVLSQLFCHVQHVQVMMPGGQCEPLFLSSLEILSQYEAIMAAFPNSCTPLECDNTRHFFSTISDNLDNPEMKAVLQQKIAQLMSSAA
ncbi:gem-associated protein 4 [Oreochromis niloticus]|uniref:Gem (nuclear organelle) associated protein 4 n=1 Tax=Oreochromis niloticus TaxID=8128 RepID=I3KGN4_ORENI|nr:gem-associated protein 4 [Oreochromis niloticus]